MDPFSITRITNLIDAHKKQHGRDISEAELNAAGIAAADIAYLVKRDLVDKYQVTNGQGARENRFKLHRDWRSLRKP